MPLVRTLGAVLLNCWPLLSQSQAAEDRLAFPLLEVARSMDWVEVAAEPPWLLRPVPATDRFSFATVRTYNKSRLHGILPDTAVVDDVRDVLFEHLQPAFGDQQAVLLLEVMLEHVVLVDAVLGKRVRKPGTAEERTEDVACYCWRMPVRKVVEQIAPRMQGRLEWVLLRDVVHWQMVDEPPAWANKLPVRQGCYRCAFAYPGRSPKTVQLASMATARDNVRAHLVELLTPIAGAVAANQAADVGIARLAPGAKVVADHAAARAAALGEDPQARRGPRYTAYCLWEVPLPALLRSLPEDVRRQAAAALRN